MKIEFEITGKPSQEQAEAFGVDAYTAYVEGRLRICILSKPFFDEQDINLIEFAKYVTRWVREVTSGLPRDFVYQTMDYPDPIIIFRYSDGMYLIESLWQKEGNNLMIDQKEVMTAFTEFLNALEIELRVSFDIELRAILRS